MFLSPKEYIIFKIKYKLINKIELNSLMINIFMHSEDIVNTINNKIASLILIAPEAIGLFFLILCILSFSTSLMSFITYTAEDIKQNDIKP